ncbi:MAG: sigma-54 dependent transcriptional regulator [Desulfosalsimonadaceae bacterium]
MDNPQILIVDDEKEMLEGLERILSYELEGVNITVSASPPAAVDFVRRTRYDLILMDVCMPEMDGIALMETVQQLDPQATIIMMTAYGSIEMAVKAIKNGAYDFISKPFDIPELVRLLKKGLERNSLIRENETLREKASGPSVIGSIVGKSLPMQRLYETIHSLANTDYAVLIRGESGTGKELVARAVHELSRRGKQKLVTANCPAIPERLLESELFGHKKGAFTGAVNDHEGLFDQADGSSLLLDEIADISVPVQTKLLRVLQEQEIRPLGSTRTRKVDVRILSTTNQNLEEKIKNRSFREDLFYRLNVVPVTTPCLREISEDIPLLVHYLARRVVEELELAPVHISPPVLENLMRREWPGNVRELQNFVRRLIVFSRGTEIDMTDLKAVDNQDQAEKSNDISVGKGADSGTGGIEQYADAKNRALNAFTEDYVRKILAKTGGNISHAAKLAGMSRVALQKILRRMDIDSEAFRESE